MKRPLAPFVALLAASRPGSGSASSHAHRHDPVRRAASSGAAASASGTPAPCPLHCENGGVCRHGSADASTLHPVHSMYTPLDVPFLDPSHSTQHSRAHCVCPAGYVGPTCAVALETCGRDRGVGGGHGKHHCFHGAPCRVGVSDLGKEFFYCECSEAGRREDGGRNKEEMYAGHMCQHASTTVCGLEGKKEDGRNRNVEEGDGGDRRRLKRSFCTNWGTCKEGGNGEEHLGCDCPEGWEGPHCEYRKGTDQSLHQHAPPTSSENNTAETSAPEKSEETPTESRRRRAGLVFVVVAAVVSIIGMGFPQYVKWWRKRNEGNSAPAAEVLVVGDVDPDGTSISLSSVSVSEVETVTAGDASVVTSVAPPVPSTDVLV